MDACTADLPSTKTASSQPFTTWAAARQARPSRPLSAESVNDYRFIWQAWCEFLAGLQVPWSAARPSDVHRFLSTLSASRSDRVLASSVTQSRYGRLLRDIYAHAVATGRITRNPVERQALPARTEIHESLVFNRSDWRLLLQNLPAAGPRWQSVRDASVLQVMAHMGLTVGEIRGLELGDVVAPGLRWIEGLPALEPLTHPEEPGACLTVKGDRTAQARDLPLEGTCATAFMAWLEVRCTLPCPLGPASPLFVSQKGAGALPLSAKSLFLLANGHIQAALVEPGAGRKGRYSSDELAHAGPMTLRNSCIVRWLDAGVPEAQVLARAGLKDASSLRRLRDHVHPGAVEGTHLS